MAQINDLVKTWREMGPVAWVESPYGWLDEEGKPVTLEPWQKAVLGAWESHRDSVRTLAISNIKKTGKTFLNAVFLAWRWLALPGEHFACGNDLEQASSRSFAMVAEMVKRHPLLSPLVRAGKMELLVIGTGSSLKSLAVDAAGNAGANHLTVSNTEAWGIVYEAGIRAWEETEPPPGKKYGLPALRIADSYAGYEGLSSTWHNLVDRGLSEGQRISDEWPIFLAGGLLLFHMGGEEARERCYRGTRAEAEAYYADQERTLRPNAFKRQHDNERTSGESAFLPEGSWETCFDAQLAVAARDNARRLVLGADASTTNDLTALVGSVYNDSTGLVEVRYVKVWKPAFNLLRGKKTVDIDATIGAEVLRLFKAGLVDRVLCDNWQLHSTVLTWLKEGIRVEELPQNSGRVIADQALYTAVVGQTIRHYNDPTLNEHIRNAIAVETPRGMRLAKEKTRLKIDAAVALSMSHHGVLIYQKTGYDNQVTWIPDPFDDEIDPEELAGKWEFEFERPFGGKWHIHHDPHPEGVTWKNCKHRNSYCLACKHELTAEGVYRQQDEEAEFWKNNPPSTPDEVPGSQMLWAMHQAQIQAAEGRKVIDNFNQLVRDARSK